MLDRWKLNFRLTPDQRAILDEKLEGLTPKNQEAMVKAARTIARADGRCGLDTLEFDAVVELAECYTGEESSYSDEIRSSADGKLTELKNRYRAARVARSLPHYTAAFRGNDDRRKCDAVLDLMALRDLDVDDLGDEANEFVVNYKKLVAVLAESPFRIDKMLINDGENRWVNRYRPKTIADCVEWLVNRGLMQLCNTNALGKVELSSSRRGRILHGDDPTFTVKTTLGST